VTEDAKGSLLGGLPLRYAALGLAALVSLWLLRGALMPFFVAMTLAYLLAPVVARLEAKMPRRRAVALVLLATVGLAAALLLWLLPFLQDQLLRLAESLPAWKAKLDARLGPFLQSHPAWAEHLRKALEGIELGPILGRLLKVSTGLLGLFLDLLSLILVPLILYHLLEDGPAMLKSLEALVPPRHRGRSSATAAEINLRLGGYIRGQIAVAAVMSLLQGAAFWALGVPYAWVLGLVAGAFNLIPYSPYLVALVPALILTGIEGGGAGRILLVAAVFTAVQKVEALYLTPVWVGRASKLHPLEVLLALIAFGHWFGVLGLLFAVPLMVCVKVALEGVLEDYRQHPWFQEEPPARIELP
jgi:predicted PurR-regulated permease PerM